MNIPEGGEKLIILMAQQLRQLTGAEKWGDNGEHFLDIFNTMSDMC